MTGSQQQRSIARFIAHLVAALGESEAAGMRPPVERRKLSTVLRECGRSRMSDQFALALSDSLHRAGVFASPPLDDVTLARTSWLCFSTAPFLPEALLFPTERDLREFVAASIGRGVFRHLRPHREGGRIKCREYHLPSGKKIDLVCDEVARGNPVAIVAIELKAASDLKLVPQIFQYVEELRLRFRDRPVKGIVIAGDGQWHSPEVLAAFSKANIAAYTYRVSFSQFTARQSER